MYATQRALDLGERVKIKVLKFGGTSVATPEARELAIQKVLVARQQGFCPVAVVSAIGRKGAPYATDTLAGLLTSVDQSVRPSPRELDLMMGVGEILSAVIFAHSLRVAGAEATALTGGQAGIYTDGNFGNARVTDIDPQNILSEIAAGSIPVVCGFQGIAEPDSETKCDGVLTTLGRGGSDTTAAAVGAALGAVSVEIYTDVDGVKTADPDFVPEAPTLRHVVYDEVAEIAHLGARVLHPRAAEIAMKNNIPLWVKSTFSDAIGTEVVSAIQPRRCSGVTHTAKLAYLQFDLTDQPVEAAAQIRQAVYASLASNDLSLYMLDMSPSGIGFGIPVSEYPLVKDLFDGLVLSIEGTDAFLMLQVGRKASKEVEAQAEVLGRTRKVARVVADITQYCTMVSVIGRRLVAEPGMCLLALRALHDENIRVIQTGQSDLSLSFLVPDVDTKRAVRALHARFEIGAEEA